MNQQEFQEYYKKNKTVVIGVPIIIFVLLLDLLILKPARIKKREEQRGTAAGTTTEQTMAKPADPTEAPVAPENQAPIKEAEPIQPPVYPALSPEIDARFAANQAYPYSQGRNIFIRIEKPSLEIVQEVLPEPEEEAFQRPEISYHGFFTLGDDRVAILRFADELLITKVGSILKRGPFFLSSVLPEKVTISDVNHEIKEFEVSLSERGEE